MRTRASWLLAQPYRLDINYHYPSLSTMNLKTTLGCIFLILVGVTWLIELPPPALAGPVLPPRETPIPTRPPDGDRHEGPAGAHIVLSVPSAPADAWTVVQWQDSAGGWHDVDGWQGTLDAGNRKMWWLAPDLFGKGPFRWLVYQGDRVRLLATSASFYLPGSAGEEQQVEVSLTE